MDEARDRAQFQRMLLGALVVVLGLQSMRFLFGSITWYLRDTVGIGVLDLIPIALAPFVAGLVVPVLTRWTTVRRAMGGALVVLVAARLVNQVSGDPAVDFWTAAVATAGFVGLLPLLMATGRTTVVGGLLAGLAVDSGVRGMSLSLDLAYQPGVWPLAGVAALSVLALGVFRWTVPIDHRGVRWGAGFALVGIGPFLLAQGLVLQNQGWTSEVAGIGGPQAQFRIALLNVVALAAAPLFERRRLPALVAAALMVAAVGAAEGDATLFWWLSLLAIPAGGIVWAAMVPDPDAESLGASGTWLVAGMTLFVALGLAYYVPIDMDIGVSQAQVRVGVAAVLGLFALVGATRVPRAPGVPRLGWVVGAAAAGLSLVGLIIGRAPEPTESVPPVRAMTYNIHSSFDTEGGFDIEAIASVIETSGATVVGLQEIPRGRLLSGVSDQVTLLQRRLGFPHVAFFGTTDPTWGNAVLSLYPITDVERVPLPLVGTPMQRGYLGVDLAIGDGTLLFISTHLQHVNDGAVHDDDPEADLYPVHTRQIGTILEAWDGREPAILVGDFNARPGWRQVDELLAAGWVDSWAEAGDGDGFTANAADPRYRIDYVFHTPDLVATGAELIESQASDHFPVVVDIGGR